jgi:hypothetical protein
VIVVRPGTTSPRNAPALWPRIPKVLIAGSVGAPGFGWR